MEQKEKKGEYETRESDYYIALDFSQIFSRYPNLKSELKYMF